LERFRKGTQVFQKLKLTFATGLLIILGACGGGGSDAPTAKFNALSVLSNGQGIARGITSNNSKITLVYAPQISATIAGANNTNGGGIEELNPSAFPVLSNTDRYVTTKGTVVSEGTTLNVTTLQNKSTTNANALFIEMKNDADSIMVIGDGFSNPPTSGVASYSGTSTANARSVIAPGQIGTFNLTVNFGTKTFTFNSTTDKFTSSGSGTIDSANGLFATSSMSIVANGVAYNGTLYGQLNGNLATSVTGIIFTNDLTPDYAGSFIGSR
jgi:hypothetical protein